MQEALLGGAGRAAARRCARFRVEARRERREDRCEARNGLGLAADHQAVAAAFTRRAAAGADVEVVMSRCAQSLRPPHVVAVVRIAAVDDDVAGAEMRHQGVEHAVDHRGRHHQPDRARRGQLRDELGERVRGHGTLAAQRRHRCRLRVVNDAFVALLHEAPHHARAHPTQTDHSELHRFSIAHRLIRQSSCPREPCAEVSAPACGSRARAKMCRLKRSRHV